MHTMGLHTSSLSNISNQVVLDIGYNKEGTAVIRVNGQIHDKNNTAHFQAMFHDATNIDIDIDCNCVLNGDIQKINGGYTFEGFCFPQAKSVKVTLLGGNVSDKNITSLETRICMFTNQVKQLFIKVSNLTVVHVGLISINGICSEKLLTMFDSGLYSGFSNIGLGHDSPVSSLLKLPNFGNDLTGLRCNIGGNVESFIKLIHQNSGTLNSLDIYSSQDLRGMDLVVGLDGKPIVYTNLKEFCFTQFCEPIESLSDEFEGIAPFSNLESLVLYGVHPFRNNIIFRDNSKVLRTLTIDLERIGVKAILEHCALEKFAYKNLQTIKIINARGRDISEQVPIDDLTQAALKIASSAQHLTIETTSKAFARSVIDGLKCGQYSDRLQVLNVADTAFNLTQMMSLLRSFPALTNLNCKPDGLGKKINSTAASSMEKVVSKVKTQNKAFKYWKMVSANGHSVEAIANMAMLVALSCPKFVSARVPVDITEEYRQHICESISKGPFSRYADRLGSLIADNE